MIRKAVLKIGAPALLALMAWNAYLAVSHLRHVQKSAALTLQISRIQAEISGVLKDLTDMETGQRGYLLTADPSYLQPYTDAKGRITTDLTGLQSKLADRPNERALGSELESLVAAKQAEMERSIDLREKGYRHRAFVLVNSNEGREYMDRARGILSSLSVAESQRFARFDLDRNASLNQALIKTILANLCLLLFTACLLAMFRYHGKVLEQEAAQSRQDLAVRDLHLEKLNSALSNQARSKTSAIQASARLLLQNYGGFLPRQGHEYAEQIREASAQMEQLRQDLVGGPASTDHEELALVGIRDLTDDQELALVGSRESTDDVKVA